MEYNLFDYIFGIILVIIIGIVLTSWAWVIVAFVVGPIRKFTKSIVSYFKTELDGRTLSVGPGGPQRVTQSKITNQVEDTENTLLTEELNRIRKILSKKTSKRKKTSKKKVSKSKKTSKRKSKKDSK